MEQFGSGRPVTCFANETALEEAPRNVWDIVWKSVRGFVARADTIDDRDSFVLVPRRVAAQHLHHGTAQAPTWNTRYVLYSSEMMLTDIFIYPLLLELSLCFELRLYIIPHIPR